MTAEANKTPKDTLQSLEAEPRPVVYSGVHDSLSGKVPSDYTEPSKAINNVHR